MKPGFEAAEARTVLATALRDLGERDRRIVLLRYFQQWSQQEIAETIGVSQMQVSRLLARILRDLNRALTANAEVQPSPPWRRDVRHGRTNQPSSPARTHVRSRTTHP